MSTITMHGVDEAVDRKIREIAHREKTSINRVTQALLRKVLGMEGRGVDHRAEFEGFVGLWSQEDLVEFDAASSAFSKVDAEDWK